jgi:hypothetical protein
MGPWWRPLFCVEALKVGFLRGGIERDTIAAGGARVTIVGPPEMRIDVGTASGGGGVRVNDRRLAMKFSMVVLAILLVGFEVSAHGQARPTATQTSRLSLFGGATGTFTGLDGGKNIGITAGADFSFRHFFGFRPAIEVRGTYPAYVGLVDGEKNVLAGLQVMRPIKRINVYGDFLVGRGEIDYPTGLFDPSFFHLYASSVSYVLSPGGGVEYDLSRHFAVRADAQYQRYSTPVTVSGKLYSTALTAAVVYRFDFNRHPRNVKYK